MLMRPVYDEAKAEADAKWREAEAEAKNIFLFKAEVKANNYQAEASCLLLLQDAY